MTRVRIIGPGRAGGSLALALGRAGWEVLPTLGRHDGPRAAAGGPELLVPATPDAVIAERPADEAMAREAGRLCP